MFVYAHHYTQKYEVKHINTLLRYCMYSGYTCICSFTTVSFLVLRRLLWVSISHNCIEKTKFDSVTLFDYLPCVLHYSYSKVNCTLEFQAHLHQYGHMHRCAFANRDFQVLISCVETKIHSLENQTPSMSSACCLRKARSFRDILFHTMERKSAWAVWTRSITGCRIFLETKYPWSEKKFDTTCVLCLTLLFKYKLLILLDVAWCSISLSVLHSIALER